ncbi:autotransporter-associated beta strand repeat-containing protein [Brucella endophytica]|uniref:autotransporter-associated beta strand repeat-containing protein n=1 Tax=Brucella endophytica TaxID=1963359 RepID=UPI003570A403
MKAGGGTLSLKGTNTFSGGINVTGGTLDVQNDAALGDAGNGVTLAGTTLNSAGGLTPSRVITLASGNSTVGGGAGSARITGSGNLMVASPPEVRLRGHRRGEDVHSAVSGLCRSGTIRFKRIIKSVLSALSQSASTATSGFT